MSLFNQINEDIKTSMKNKDAFKLSVIRMVKGAMQLEVINNISENGLLDIKTSGNVLRSQIA